MPRRSRPPRRPVGPDPRFNNRSVSRFINVLMQDGRKSLAQKLLYGALDIVQDRTQQPPVDVFESAIRNATPQLEVRSRRVGGATYQVPVEIRGDRRYSLAVRWLVRGARERSGNKMVDRLAAELIDASNNEGAAVRRKEDGHRMAEANKAFAHYRW